MGLLISVNSAKHGFYDWVMFRDEPIQYPDENTVLDRYLKPEINFGPAMTANIMKGNYEVVNQSTYPGLKEYECTNQAHISLKKDFDSNIKDRFGPDILPDAFPDVNLEDTPLYEIYEDDTTYVEVFFPGNNEYNEDPVMATGLDRKVPMTEANDNYVNASVMLPRDNSCARGKVK